MRSWLFDRLEQKTCTAPSGTHLQRIALPEQRGNSRLAGAALAGKDVENGHKEEEAKPNAAKAGVTAVPTEKGEQEVDFKTLTADEAFQVLNVRAY